MIIIMKKNATDAQVDRIVEWIASVGYSAHLSRGVERTIVGAVGDDRGKAQLKTAEFLPGVDKVMPILKPYKLASREVREGDTVIRVGDLAIGGPEFIVMAGPCSVESEEQLMASAYVAKKAGAHILRGGAFKPRTSPYSFQGMAEDGRISVRNLRRSGRQELEAFEKDGDLSEDELARAEKELDKITQAAEAEIDAALSTKEQELLED